MRVTYGDIIIANLSPTVGSEQGGKRPCIIVQNNVGNVFSSTTIIIPITSSMDKKYIGPTHFIIRKNKNNNLACDGVVLCEQIRVIDKKRMLKKIGCLNDQEIKDLKKSMSVCISL